MHHLAVAHVVGLVSGTGGAQAEVGFLEIEEVGLVEEPDLIQHRLPHHQRGPGQPVDRQRAIRDVEPDAMGVQQPGHGAEAGGGLELGERRGKAEGAVVGGTVLAVDVAAGKARLGVSLEMPQQRPQAVRAGEGVGVQQVDVVGPAAVGPARADAHVVTRAEAAVVPGLDQPHRRAGGPWLGGKRGVHGLERAVAAVVVDDHQLGLEPLHLAQRVLHRAQRHRGSAIVQRYDQKLGHGLLRRPAVGKGHQLGAPHPRLGMADGLAHQSRQHPHVGFEHHRVVVSRHLVHFDMRHELPPVVVVQHVGTFRVDHAPLRDLPLADKRRAVEHQRPVPGRHLVGRDGGEEGGLDLGVVEAVLRRGLICGAAAGDLPPQAVAGPDQRVDRALGPGLLPLDHQPVARLERAAHRQRRVEQHAEGHLFARRLELLL